MVVRCMDCKHFEKQFGIGDKNVCAAKVIPRKVRPRKEWNCPIKRFSPTEKARSLYIRPGGHWTLRKAKKKTPTKRRPPRR